MFSHVKVHGGGTPSRVGSWFRDDVEQYVTVSVLFAAAGYLAIAELLTRVGTGLAVSLNLVLSTIILFAVGVVSLLQGRWLVLTAYAAVLLLALLSGLEAGNGLRHMQYFVPTLVFLILVFIVLSRENSHLAQRLMFVAALSVLPIWSVAWMAFDFPLPRASDPVVPLAVLVLLFMSSAMRHWLKITAVTSTLLLLGYLALTTARMAFAVTWIVLVIWIWLSSHWPLRMKILSTALLGSASLLYWLGGTWQRERLFGRDATIDIGPVSLNGEGRVEAAQLILQSPSGSSIWQVVFGNGGGTSGERLVDAGFILDKPHNEFIRVFVDGGLVLTTALVALLLLPAAMGILNYRRTRDRTLLLLPTLISLILLGFSMTDNALSYIWLMLPAGVLVSWSRSNALNWAPVTNQLP